MAATRQRRPASDTNYLFHVTVTDGYNQGSERLYSIPQSMRVVDFSILLDNPAHPSFNTSGYDSMTLLLPVTLGDDEYPASIDVTTDGHLEVGDLDGTEFHLVVTFWLCSEGRSGFDHVEHTLQYIGQATAQNQGEIACLSGRNLSIDHEVAEFDINLHMRDLRKTFGKDKVAS
ncbi:hypothetical protein MMC18_000106 [Xylographa bjoerkii]|nr:hypothetical protein [Xylographa bjoerkii]